MKGLNKAYLIGHIGTDPELRTNAAGKQIVKLTLGTPNGKKVGEEWVDVPDWHRLTLYDKQAEFVAAYAKKGDVLAVECAIRPHKWTGKDNVVRYEVNLIVDRVLWLNGKHSKPETRVGPSNVHDHDTDTGDTDGHCDMREAAGSDPGNGED